MNPPLPPYDKVQSLKLKIQKYYTKASKKNNKSTSESLLVAIFLSHKLETAVIFLGQIVVAVIANSAVFLINSAFSTLSTKPLYHHKGNSLAAGSRLLGGISATLLAGIISLYLKFYSLRVSLGVRSALFSLIQDKVLRFSTKNSRVVSEGLIADLVQVDIVYFNKLFYNVYLASSAVIGIPSSLTLLVIFL